MRDTRPERYECDRCGVPTKGVFEGESVSPSNTSQLSGGLRVQASGYYGGFWDTMSFMGEGPVTLFLCHDCSVWLTHEIPKMALTAKGGHFSSSMQNEGVLHGPGRDLPERCCEFGSVDHEQGVDPTGAYDNPKERLS